jgi:cathepsin A (carboxypeptidase C)
MKILFLLAFASVAFLKQSVYLPGANFESGLIDLGNGDDMFYLLFRSDNVQEAPLLIWLNGGPGCSSLLSAFYSNGPFYINTDSTLMNNYSSSWTDQLDVLYVDNPLGTGYSQCKDTDCPGDEQSIARTFYQFLSKFYSTYPEYNKRQLYISGDGYAGHYIPAIGSYIALEGHDDDINLTGVAIGSGWVNPSLQYTSLVDYSQENGLINTYQYYSAKAAFKACQVLIDNNAGVAAVAACKAASTILIGDPSTPWFNPYNISKDCKDKSCKPDWSAMGPFLAREEIKYIFGVGDRKWTACNADVENRLMNDSVSNIKNDIKILLDYGIRVMAYYGDKDWMYNWRGGQAWTNAQPWAKQEEFNAKLTEKWKIKDKDVGEFKAVDGFVFLRVYDAGYYLPQDQPQIALEMINQFVQNLFK